MIIVRGRLNGLQNWEVFSLSTDPLRSKRPATATASVFTHAHRNRPARFTLKGGEKMLRWALIFLIIALIAAVFGFTGIAVAAAGIAKFLFFLFLVICLIFFIFGVWAARKIS
jgi:uncharacterized membrane protein YtjA (UPF0391 family)